MAVGGTIERRPSPDDHSKNYYHHMHHHNIIGGQQPPQHMMQQVTKSIACVPGSESFSEMTSETGSMQSGIPVTPVQYPQSFNRERSNQSAGTSRGGGDRESVFSETSTEPSISSTSEKEMSLSKY